MPHIELEKHEEGCPHRVHVLGSCLGLMGIIPGAILGAVAGAMAGVQGWREFRLDEESNYNYFENILYGEE